MIQHATKTKAFENFRLHKIPGWMRLRILRNAKIPYQHNNGWQALFFFCDRLGAGHDWLDHFGSAKLHGRQCFVSQPYGLCNRSTAQLLDFCTRLGLEFEIDAESDWNPPSKPGCSTIGIAIFEPMQQEVRS